MNQKRQPDAKLAFSFWSEVQCRTLEILARA